MSINFKNRIKTLSEKDFSEILLFRDEYSAKEKLIIDQEARNRFFTNKEFNGADDEYVISGHLVENHGIKHNLVYSGSVAFIVVLVLIFGFIFVKNYKSNSNRNLASSNVNEINETAKANSNSDKNNIANMPVVTGKDDKLNADKNQPQILPEPQKPLNSNVLNAESDKKRADSAIAALKNATETKVEQTSPSNKEISNKVVAINEVDQKEQKTETTENQEAKNTLPEKKVISDKTETQEANSKETFEVSSKQKNQVSDISEISKDNLKLLLQFQYKWANENVARYKFADYYIEQNTKIIFKLNENASDSVNFYRQNHIPKFIDRYWKSLSKELGANFPNTKMDIIFVKFNEEL